MYYLSSLLALAESMSDTIQHTRGTQFLTAWCLKACLYTAAKGVITSSGRHSHTSSEQASMLKIECLYWHEGLTAYGRRFWDWNILRVTSPSCDSWLLAPMTTKLVHIYLPELAITFSAPVETHPERCIKGHNQKEAFKTQRPPPTFYHMQLSFINRIQTLPIKCIDYISPSQQSERFKRQSCECCSMFLLGCQLSLCWRVTNWGNNRLKSRPQDIPHCLFRRSSRFWEAPE